MATPSELTLHVIDFLQSAPEAEAPSSPARWMFMPPPTRWPGGFGYTFADAAAYLDGLLKPAFIGALNHPGAVAVWPRSSLPSMDADYLDSLISNQLAALEDMLPILDSPATSTILFDTGAETIRVSLGDFKQWLGDYGLTWGWRLGMATDAGHSARFLVLKDGRRWSRGDRCGPSGDA